MPGKITRNKFITLSLLGSAGMYLNSGGLRSDKVPIANSNNSIITTVPQQSAVPTFKLYNKTDDEYNVLRKGFNKRVDNFPSAIALCITTEEVAEAIAYAKTKNLSISVKSGGHSFEGFSCVPDSLVLNLSLMNEIVWETDDIISVGPSCKLSEIYNTVLSKNKLLPAGSCGSVGIGGLTLGGGYGLFSRKYGLTCDHLLEITMVDGNGNIVSSKNDPELLWACKGGGNGNFGVITSMKFSLDPSPVFLQSCRFTISLTNNERVLYTLEQWFAITENLPPSCFSAFVLNEKSIYILLTNCDAQNEDFEDIVQRLSALVDKTSVEKPVPLIKAVKTFYGITKPLYFKNASAGFYKNFEDIKNCIADVIENVTAKRGMIYQVNTLGGKIKDTGFAERSSYSHRDKNYLAELQTYWDSSLQTEVMVRAFYDVQQIFYKAGVKDHYLNYPDIDLKDWEQAYYGANYIRLQKVKSKYDPGNYFSYGQSIRNIVI